MNEIASDTSLTPGQMSERTGVSMDTRYCELGEQGTATEVERFEMLTEHRRLVAGGALSSSSTGRSFEQ